MENFIGSEGLETLVQTFQAISPLPQAFYVRLLPMLKQENLPKGTVLLRAGEIARRVYFISSGMARASYADANERLCTGWFMREGDVMISVYSFYTGQPSHETIELCERSRLFSITRRQLDTLYSEFPQFNLHGRELTQQYYIRSEQRAIMLRLPLVGDRIELFKQLEPAIEKRISDPLAASYLNTTKESISRYRNSQNVDARQQTA